MGVRVLRTPVRAPKGNSYCERMVRTARRECLDFMIPFGERQLRRILVEWVAHYNQARPHKSLGPGIPAPIIPLPPPSGNRRCLPSRYFVRVKPVLAGYTMSVGWKRPPCDARIEFLRASYTQIFAIQNSSFSPN